MNRCKLQHLVDIIGGRSALADERDLSKQERWERNDKVFAGDSQRKIFPNGFIIAKYLSIKSAVKKTLQRLDTYGPHFGCWLVVTNRWSNFFSRLKFSRPFVATNSVAPSAMDSFFFLSVLEKATTSQPHLLAYWMARCPRPPIPMTPTRSPGLTYRSSELNTVCPAQKKGAASASVRPVGRRWMRVSG